MKNKKSVFLFITCLVFAIGLFLGVGKDFFAQGSVASANPSPTPQEEFYGSAAALPEELKYLFLFQELREMGTKDSENAAAGQTTYFKDAIYEDRLGLQAAQASSVDSIIGNCFAQIQPLDQRAHEVIAQYRSQFPNGELKRRQSSEGDKIASGAKTEALPPIPAELTQLQAQKNQLILNARASIKQSLGSAAFENFNSAVEKNAARILAPINSRPAQPRKVPTPNP